MSSTPPPGFGYWAISVTTTGSSHTSVITCGFSNPGPLSAAANNVLLRQAMAAGTTPFIPAQMAVGYTVSNTYVLVNNGGTLLVDNDPTPIVGTLSLSTPSLNTALIVKKVTANAGRQFRGRFFAPPMRVAETDISIAGVISGTSLSTNTAIWDNFRAFLVGKALVPYLIHDTPLSGVKPPPTQINFFVPTPLIGTIKRRIRK